MNNFFDIRTILFSSIITSAICAIVMNSLWWQNRRRSPELVFWQADFILQFAAILLIALRGILPDVISVLLGVPCILLGALLMLLGLERYTGKPSTQRYNFILLAVFSLVHGYFSFVHPSLLVRNINQSVGLLVYCGQCAWLLLRRVDSALRPYTRPVGLIFAVYSLVSLVRIFVDLVVPRQNDLFKLGLYDTLAILIYQMLFIGLTFALFLMVNRRLFIELERDIAERKMAEAALHISEEKFSVAFQNTPDALVITLLPDGKIIEANESFFRMSGFSKAESLGRTTVELNLWGNLADRNQMVETLRQQHRVLNFETDFRKKSGDLFRGSISGELIQLQGQTCVLNVIRDISERKQAEEEIRRLSKFPAENPNPVLRIDRAGRILYANLSSAPILAAWDRNVGQDAPEDWRAHIADVFASGKTREFELDYQEKVFLCDLTPVPEEEYINMYGLDITERKQAEDALRESEERLKLAQQSSNTGWWDWDMATGQLKWSQELFELFGLDPETARATFEAWDQVMHPDDKTSAYELLDIAVKNGTYLDSEYRVIHPGGQIKWVRAMGRASYDPEQKPVRMTGICIDITARKQAEEALRESEDKFKYVFDNSFIGKSITLPSGEINVNKAFCEMLGYTQEELKGGKWQEISHPDDIELTQEIVNALLSGEKESARFTKRYLHKNGAVVWTDLSTALRRDKDGQPLYFMTTVSDITERKQMETALRESRAILQAAMDQSSAGIAIADVPDGKLRYVNDAGLLIRGSDRQTIVDGIGIDQYVASWQLLDLDGRPLKSEEVPLARAILFGETNSREFIVRRTGNDDRIVFANAAPIKDDTGKVLAGIVVFTDITARKQTEEALRASEERFRRAVLGAPFPIMLHAEDGEVVTINTPWTQLTGYEHSDIPTIADWTQKAYGTRMDLVRADIDSLYALDGPKAEGEYIIMTHSGQTRTWDFSSAPIGQLPDGRRLVISMAMDVTERKRMEQALQDYNLRLETDVEQRTRELRAAQEQLVRQERLAMLGQVAGSIGHELRNPLGVISNAVYYLKMSQPEASDKVKEYLDILEKETRTSDKIVTDLLDFARIKTLDREPAAVSELIHQTLERYPAPRGVQVALEIPSGLPRVFVDPQHMVQVLGNLAVNAYQAMEKQPGLKGTASLRERAGSTGALANRKLTVSAVVQGDMMILAVQDTGTGIPPENMDKLFEPLFTTKVRGIGLGLAVSKKLVEANGGRVEVQSEPGRGSVFTIYLPIHQEFK